MSQGALRVHTGDLRTAGESLLACYRELLEAPAHPVVEHRQRQHLHRNQPVERRLACPPHGARAADRHDLGARVSRQPEQVIALSVIGLSVIGLSVALRAAGPAPPGSHARGSLSRLAWVGGAVGGAVGARDRVGAAGAMRRSDRASG